MTKTRRTVKLISNEGSPLIALKTERNAPCRCGKGKKQKYCCGAGTRYHYTGQALERKREEKRPSMSTKEMEDLTREKTPNQ